MKKQNPILLAIAAICSLLFVPVVLANIEASDNTNVAVPSANGTSSQINVTTKMQEYVGFFGEVSSAVRRNATNGYILFNRTMTSGKLYFYKTGALVDQNVVRANTSGYTSDSNFSLTGEYNTSSTFTLVQTVCGVSTDALNTTDGYLVGIFRNETGSPANYFLCVNLMNLTSTNGFGLVQYEAVVPKTSAYTAYDIYYDFS